MVNSLEQYRQRIGSYQFSGTKPRRRYRSTFSNTKLFNSVFKQSGRKTNLKEVSYCIIFYIIIFSVIEKIPLEVPQEHHSQKPKVSMTLAVVSVPTQNTSGSVLKQEINSVTAWKGTGETTVINTLHGIVIEDS